MIRHSFAEREVGSWLPTETAQTRSRSWQLNPEKAKCPIPPRAPAGSGNMSTLCALKHLAVARYRRYAFPGIRQWQYAREMRSQAAIRGKFCAPCIPKVASGGKSAPPWQHIAAVHPKRAGVGKICAPCIRKAPQIAFRERTARRSCHEGAAFAARTPRIMHGARMLPSVVASNRPSARNTGAAEQRELDRSAQETQPRRQRPRRLLGSKYRQQPPRYRHRSLPTPASSLSPRRTTLSSPTAPPVETTSTPPPPRQFAELRSPKGRATFPTCGACLLCSWQMRSVCKRQTEPLLRDYFVMVA